MERCEAWMDRYQAARREGGRREETARQQGKCEANRRAAQLMCFLTPGSDAPQPTDRRIPHPPTHTH